MSEEITIDQVIVRKAGGYNLRSVDWWKGLTPNDRHSLIAKGDVQFFSAGSEMPAAEAAAMLEGGSSSAMQETAAPVPTGPVVLPAFITAPEAATYTRRVVAGPRWMVTRKSDGTETELHELHGHTDPSVYDLATSDGATQLSNDVLLDALGAPASFVAEHPEAFAHFKETVFDLHLGNRPWEVLGRKISGSLTSNPYLQITAVAPTS